MLQSPLLLNNRWRVYPLTIADQQQHIDWSEQLLATLQPGDQPVLYWSVAERTALVLGFSQRQQILNEAAALALDIPIYQRRAGGTAVLVGPSLLSLDVVLPAGHPLILADIVESYRWFGEAWVAALKQLGIETRAVPIAEAHAQRALRKDPATREYESLLHRACYGSLSPYEVVVGKRKVVGFDMIRRRAGCLLQAGVLLHWEPELLAQLLGHSAAERELLRSGLLERAGGLDTLAGRSIGIDETMAVFESIVSTLL